MTTPAEPAGAVAVIEVAELSVNMVAAKVPNLTEVTPTKLAPVIATTVPPATGPDVGLSPVMVGAAT